MKFFVKTTGDRKLHKSFNQIKYSFLVDKQHHVGKAFFKWLRKMRKQDCVVLEDDIVLCENFEARINATISIYPDRLTNFFADYHNWTESHWKEGEWSNTQCVYYPKEVSQQLYKFYKKYPIYKLFNKHSPLLAETMYLLHMKSWIHLPCLVQHLDFDSLIYGLQTCNGARRTPYFVDNLVALGAVKDITEFNNLEIPLTIDSFDLNKIAAPENAYNEQLMQEYREKQQQLEEWNKKNKNKKDFIRRIMKDREGIGNLTEPQLIQTAPLIKVRLDEQMIKHISNIKSDDFIKTKVRPSKKFAKLT